MCIIGDFKCAASEFAKSAGQGFLDQIASAVSVSMASAIETLGTFWVGIPTIRWGILRVTHLTRLNSFKVAPGGFGPRSWSSACSMLQDR